MKPLTTMQLPTALRRLKRLAGRIQEGMLVSKVEERGGCTIRTTRDSGVVGSSAYTTDKLDLTALRIVIAALTVQEKPT